MFHCRRATMSCIIPTCGLVKLEVLRQLTKLLRLAIDMVRGPPSSHFTALSAINRIVDICVIHGVYHPWKLEDTGQPLGGTAINTPSPMEPSMNHGLRSSASKDRLPNSFFRIWISTVHEHRSQWGHCWH